MRSEGSSERVPDKSLRQLVRVLRHKTRLLSPLTRERWREHREFDATHHVSTAGNVYLEELDIPVAARESSYWYEPVNPWKVREAIDAAHVDFARTTFVDLGSGKGRMLFVAADYPFAELVGVELAQSLYAQARRNLGTFVATNRKSAAIRLVHGDAMTFPLPRGDLFIAIYNAFNGSVLANVLERLRPSLWCGERIVHLAYINPVHHVVVEAGGLFAEVKRHKAFRVYESVGPDRTSVALKSAGPRSAAPKSFARTRPGS